MFGTNEIVGQKYFKNAPKDSLFVTSMFFTLQGEGPYSGKPAVFIRLAKCNLNCSFCDTFFDDGDWMTFEEIESRAEQIVINYWGDRNLAVPDWVFNYRPAMDDFDAEMEEIDRINCVLVITGGEPLLQTNIGPFLEKASRWFENTQIESNGILDTAIPECTVLVCSPKCAEKNGKSTQYLKPTRTILERADCLKFVMSADVNSPYHTIPDWAIEWGQMKGEIYCSPMNIYNDFPQKIKLLRAEKGKITMAERSTVDEIISFWEPGLLNLKENQLNHEYTARYCMDHGFKLNLQMHLYASLA
jgi:7-carboxy-7-deazaguanine synthase